VARAVTVGSCLHETVSAVRCLGSAHSETYGFSATRRSLAAPRREQKVATFGPRFLLYMSQAPLKPPRGAFGWQLTGPPPTPRTRTCKSVTAR